jgi:hypothetical protein
MTAVNQTARRLTAEGARGCYTVQLLGYVREPGSQQDANVKASLSITEKCLLFEFNAAKKYSGPSRYDRLDIRTTWVTTKILVLSYATKVLSYDPHAGQGHLSYDPHGVRKLQSEAKYAWWT